MAQLYKGASAAAKERGKASGDTRPRRRRRADARRPARRLYPGTYTVVVKEKTIEGN
jgi:hypothetical protein